MIRGQIFCFGGFQMDTYFVSEKDNLKEWYIVDAADKILGRLATKIAQVLMGKHKPTYTPHMEMGDFVIVINADKVKVTGTKADKKIYYHHSGYPGGLTEIPYKKMQAKAPEKIIIHAVKGMLPNNKLRSRRIAKLKVYTEYHNEHQAQQPKELVI
jgi:large subunit ribosomal protein L13